MSAATDKASRIVPAVPIIDTKPESTKSDAALSLNASHAAISSTRESTALASPVEGSSDSVSDALLDQTIAQMDKVQIAEFHGVKSKLKDISDLQIIKPIEEGLQYDAKANALVLTCDTNDLKNPMTGNQFIAKLINASTIPTHVQLNIMTGPELSFLQEATKWFRNCLGQFMGYVQCIQITIIRSGEVFDKKWSMVELDMTSFPPLVYAITSILEFLPPQTKVEWGSSEELVKKLRIHFYSKIDGDTFIILQEMKTNNVETYSRAIEGHLLAKIAAEHAEVMGSKFGKNRDEDLHPTQHSRHGSHSSSSYNYLNPNAMSFQPPYAPNLPPYMTHVPFFSRGPFQNQMSEVDQYRRNWVPSIYDLGAQVPSTTSHPNSASGFYPAGIPHAVDASMYVAVDQMGAFHNVGMTSQYATNEGYGQNYGNMPQDQVQYHNNVGSFGNVQQPGRNMGGHGYPNLSFDSRGYGAFPQGQDRRSSRPYGQESGFYGSAATSFGSGNASGNRASMQTSYVDTILPGTVTSLPYSKNPYDGSLATQPDTPYPRSGNSNNFDMVAHNKERKKAKAAGKAASSENQRYVYRGNSRYTKHTGNKSNRGGFQSRAEHQPPRGPQSFTQEVPAHDPLQGHFPSLSEAYNDNSPMGGQHR